FKWVPNAQPLTGRLAACPGGGDTELATDSHNHLYFNDLSLANFSTARSSNFGATFTPPNCVAVPGAVVDRQWYAVDGDPTQPVSSSNPNPGMFLAYDQVAQGSPACPGGNPDTNHQLVISRS